MKRMPRLVLRTGLCFLAAAGLSAATASAQGAAKKPFGVADLYRLKGVEEPALSPDGKTIVYKVTTSDLQAVKRWPTAEA